jgi:RNA polymerase sigma-70 factor (ECF subfamily)
VTTHEPFLDAADARRAQAGDREAFAALVARHTRRVHDLARRMLRDAGEAEDVAQQAFWNAWRALERFDPERPFRNWLLRITTNLCRNRFEARRRRREVRPKGGADPLPDIEAPSAQEPAGTPLGVREAVASLPERYRLPIVLHYFHGLALEDVSEVTGVPVATLKTHLHRGRQALRGRLGQGETADTAGGTDG